MHATFTTVTTTATTRLRAVSIYGNSSGASEWLREQMASMDAAMLQRLLARRQGLEHVDALLLRASSGAACSVLLRYGAQVTHRDGSSGNTALHYARNGDVARVLIEAGAALEARNRTGLCPLHVARCASVVEALVRAGADPNRGSDSGRTPLHCAQDAAVVRALLRCGGKVEARDACDCTPLHYARDEHCARALLEYGAPLEARATHTGVTALHVARDEFVLRALLEAGANVDAQDAASLSLLHRCMQREAQSLRGAIRYPLPLSGVRSLLAAGANLEAIDLDGRTPLHVLVASFAQHCSAEVRYVGRGSRMLSSCSSYSSPQQQQRSPPMRSHVHDEQFIACDTALRLDLLLESGANVNALDANGCTPLMLATQAIARHRGWELAVRKLIAAGAQLFVTACPASPPRTSAFVATAPHATVPSPAADATLRTARASPPPVGSIRGGGGMEQKRVALLERLENVQSEEQLRSVCRIECWHELLTIEAQRRLRPRSLVATALRCIEGLLTSE